jgi:hypothetical protein
MCFSYESAPIHRLFAQCGLHNAIAVPMADEGEAFKRGVTKGKSAMTERIKKVFSRNQQPTVKIRVRSLCNVK